ncbi:MAG: ATP-binding cassette domain-containing protein [Campylobacteraceae bacterium]
MKKLFEVKNLNIFFTCKDYLLENLNFSINEGEVIAIVGKSGIGKTVLLRSILNLLPKDLSFSGEFYWQEKLINETKQNALRGEQISLIPQNISYFDPLMRVGKFACGKFGKSKMDDVKKLFIEFGLRENDTELYPYEISGGMARKILLITAIISDAALFLADEPTVGLDNKSILHVKDIFSKMKEKNKSVILVTHDINFALDVASKVIILHDKKIVETLNAKNPNPINTYTKALFSTMVENDFINSPYINIKTKDKLEA